MRIDQKNWRSIWLEADGSSVNVIDQTKLPFEFGIRSFHKSSELIEAIQFMVVRGAPLIGVVGAYGLMLAMREDPSDSSLINAFDKFNKARPTAVNLQWAIKRVFDKVKLLPLEDRANSARIEADLIAEEDVAMSEAIGENGLLLFRDLLSNRPIDKVNEPLNILTHCNAGWLATVDWGTALAPIYKAYRAGINIHVWVDETRPRNQGASLTAYELGQEGVPYTLVVDNAGGYLMQNGQVDAVIVGSDRVTSTGDVCNKIGTYLKALAAKDNNVPFYVAMPYSTIDWSVSNGLSDIPIEVRSEDEIKKVKGRHISELSNSRILSVEVAPMGSKAFNPAFDVTPARLVSALITEKGVAKASKESLRELYPQTDKMNFKTT